MHAKPSKLRRQIAWEAARLMYQRQESEYYRAKLKAARRMSSAWVKPADLPSNAEIRDQVQLWAHLFEGEERRKELREMRFHALRVMRMLAKFRPRLIGSVLTGHVRSGSDIDLHVFSDSVEAVALELEHEGMVFDITRKRVRKGGEERTYVHLHVRDRFPLELTIYPANKAHFVFKSSITGKAMERASIAELEHLLTSTYPNVDLDQAIETAEAQLDRFQIYEVLLLPLENVKQNPEFHPEGDALYHSLQVVELARDEQPYDEEFLLAALLHDVGKAIDRGDHITAGLEALQGFITERTEWLIAHHMEGHAIRDGSIGVRAHRRLQASENYDDLLLLSDCDRAGRETGVLVPDIDEVLDYLRELALMCG
jgi:predicted nucleotidyltransferase